MSGLFTRAGAYVDGAWTAGPPATLPVHNPATATPCGAVAAGGAPDAERALAAAARAAGAWRALSLDARAGHILAYRDVLVSHRDEIVALLVAETGKLDANAAYDFDMLVDCLPFHVEEARRLRGCVFPSPDGKHLSYTRYTPCGVVVCVLTWNFPLLNLGYKLGPLLAAGCTTVLKPSEMTPLATARCVELLSEVADPPFPPGVVNLVNGTGVDLVEPLCASPIPRVLTTIGSTAMGRYLIQYSCATTVKRFSLELGGDAPVLVFADCDLDAAVDDVVGLKFANAGQICVAPNRCYVAASVYEAFLRKAAAKIAAIVLGAGDAEAQSGEGVSVCQPVVSEQSLARLLGFVEDAKANGGRVLAGGKRAEGLPGYFLEPTLIADASPAMRCSCEEMFGPILAVRSWDAAAGEDPFALANDTDLGLAAYVYTKSLDTALRAELELECGNICINGAHYSIELPHGGLKQSGNGKDISHLALLEYMDVKRITMKRG